MKNVLKNTGVNEDLILSEILNQTLQNKEGRYGPYHGLRGVYQVQAPEENQMSLDLLDYHLHQAQLMIVDELNAIIPASEQHNAHFHFAYSSGDAALLYLPADVGTVSDFIKTKLVPFESIRHLHDTGA